jgi:hypothetical protein
VSSSFTLRMTRGILLLLGLSIAYSATGRSTAKANRSAVREQSVLLQAALDDLDQRRATSTSPTAKLNGERATPPVQSSTRLAQGTVPISDADALRADASLYAAVRMKYLSLLVGEKITIHDAGRTGTGATPFVSGVNASGSRVARFESSSRRGREVMIFRNVNNGAESLVTPKDFVWTVTDQNVLENTGSNKRVSVELEIFDLNSDGTRRSKWNEKLLVGFGAK